MVMSAVFREKLEWMDQKEIRYFFNLYTLKYMAGVHSWYWET